MQYHFILDCIIAELHSLNSQVKKLQLVTLCLCQSIWYSYVWTLMLLKITEIYNYLEAARESFHLNSTKGLQWHQIVQK